MPIYNYACSNCGLKQAFQHSYDEKLKICPVCGATEEFKKVLSTFNTSDNFDSKNKKVGDLTKEYIEENRKVLEDQKREMKKKTHDGN